MHAFALLSSPPHPSKKKEIKIYGSSLFWDGIFKSSQLRQTAPTGRYAPGAGEEQRMKVSAFGDPISATYAMAEGRKLKAGVTFRPSQSGGRYRQLDGGL